MSLIGLGLKRNRGWPWPEKSFGLSPMFDDDGWCGSCAVPKHEQTGSLVLQPKGMHNAQGAWVPNWRFDAYCLSGDLAAEVTEQFNVDLRPIEWSGRSKRGPAFQVVAPPSRAPWFDEAAVSEAAIAKHGRPGAECVECGVWRWLPLGADSLPVANIVVADGDVVASPEWFGDGWKAFRQIAFAPALAELIASASPRDFLVRPWS